MGRSLGIDLISREKTCSFDCLYCQLGKTKKLSTRRQVFVPTKELIKELENLPPLEIDCITFSGSGEPTLAKNLGKVITEIKKRFKTRVAVLTDSSSIDKTSVREELGQADIVIAKLDAADQKTLKAVNRPAKGISMAKIIKGLKAFNREYPGKLYLQIMFIPHNKEQAEGIAALAKDISPAAVEINTPLRPSGASPLPHKELSIIRKMFAPLTTYYIYEAKRPQAKPLDLQGTLKRRPKL